MSERPAKRARAGAAEPKLWRRERPGSYLSADDRFRVDQEGPGRWFVLDQEQVDELGLPRTTGPFATLDDAREEADRIRSMPAVVSPLLPRIAEARERARRQPKGKAAKGDSVAQAATSTSTSPRAKAAHPPPPPPPTWLDRLPPEAASRARRRIASLRRLGIVDAENLVRSDVEADRPAVARTLVARRLRIRALDRWRRAGAFEQADAGVRGALARAANAGVGEEDLTAIASFVARTTLAATLDQVAGLEHDPDAPPGLPGWRFGEHDPDRPGPGRRIDVRGDDVERLKLEPGPAEGD